MIGQWPRGRWSATLVLTGWSWVSFCNRYPILYSFQFCTPPEERYVASPKCPVVLIERIKKRGAGANVARVSRRNIAQRGPKRARFGCFRRCLRQRISLLALWHSICCIKKPQPESRGKSTNIFLCVRKLLCILTFFRRKLHSNVGFSYFSRITSPWSRTIMRYHSSRYLGMSGMALWPVSVRRKRPSFSFLMLPSMYLTRR